MQSQIFIGNLARYVNQEELKEHFSAFGQIIHAYVMLDRKTNRSRGFGFITFSTEAAARQAIQVMDGKMIDGRPIRVTLARPLITKSSGKHDDPEKKMELPAGHPVFNEDL